MRIGSSSYAGVTRSPVSVSRLTEVVAGTNASKTSMELSPRPTLFSGGQFVGTAQLTSPQTLAALFQLNDDGSVKLGDLGAPVMKKGVTIETPQDDMAKFLAFGASSTWSASDRDAASRLSLITDDDKTMFRQITGYNLFISGPAARIVDDEGNVPSVADQAAAEELFSRIQFARESGIDMDADWFSDISKDVIAAGGPTFPADWEGKAGDWFDDLLAARRENLAATDNRASTFASTARRDALDAYENALNRSANSSQYVG